MYHCPKCHYGYVNPGGMNRGPPPHGYGYTPENQCIFI